jgi:hypothetical protein
MIIPRALLKKRKPPRISLAEPHPDDVERLEELESQGSRLKLPHPVRVHLQVDGESAARDAIGLLDKEGWRCRLRAEQDGHWTVIGIMDMVPSKGGIAFVREELDRVGKDVGGRYLGWDAPIVA